jgi:hypothetical protein
MNFAGPTADRQHAATSAGRHRQIGYYFAALTVISALADPEGLITLPVLFTLKEHLGQSPEAIAILQAVIFIPACLGFAFGLLRDRWLGAWLYEHGRFITALVIDAMATLLILPVLRFLPRSLELSRDGEDEERKRDSGYFDQEKG